MGRGGRSSHLGHGLFLTALQRHADRSRSERFHGRSLLVRKRPPNRIKPKGYKKVIDVQFDLKSSHPLKGGDRNAVRAAFPNRAELKGVDRVLITTDKCPNGHPFEFDPPFPNH